MRPNFLSIFFFLLLVNASFASVDDFHRAVSDSPDSLIYPQQLLISPDDRIYILDTVSNSSHVKIYSQKGELLSSPIPAGAGFSPSKFDLGLTLISGKNIISVGNDNSLFLLDSEDGWPIIKSYNEEGKLKSETPVGSPLPESSYGAIAVDGSMIYVEYDDQIFITDTSLKNDFERFIGKSGEPIDNWDIANRNLVILFQGEITVFNESAVPIAAIDIPEILGNPSSLDIFDISLSSDGFIAITGSCILSDEKEMPFLVVLDRFGEVRSIIYPDKYVKSLDWGKSNELYAMVSSGDKVQISRFDLSLKQISSFEIPVRKPALLHPGKISIASDDTIWIDDQYDSSVKNNPYGLNNSVVLSLKSFKDQSNTEIILDNLGSNRIGTVYLGEANGVINLSGIKTDSKGFPIATPVYDVSFSEEEILVDSFEDSKFVLLNSRPDSNEYIFMEPDSGDLFFGGYFLGNFTIARKLIGWDEIDEGIPAIFPIGSNKAILQIQTFSDNSYNPICSLDLINLKPAGIWKPSEYIDLQVLYSCNDGTAVLYWFPQGLIRVDSDFKVLAWINLGDDAAYNFTTGCFRDGKHYILDARYNLVYSFDDSAWERIDRITIDDVRTGTDKIRNLIGDFYAYYRKYPESLNELVRSGITDEKNLAELFKPFMGEAPVLFLTQKYDYTLILWGKDDDNTIIKANSRGIEQL